MFLKAHKEYLVPGIEKYIIPKSETVYKTPVHVIPDEGEILRSKNILRIHQILRTTIKTQTQTRLCMIEY